MTKYKPESSAITAESITDFCTRFTEGKLKVRGECRGGKSARLETCVEVI